MIANQIKPFLLGSCLGVMIYTLVWTGYTENYTLTPLVQLKNSCYSYDNKSDIKNIARHAIINSSELGYIELLAQRHLTVFKADNDYIVSGWPYHLNLLYYRLSNRDYIPKMTVWLNSDNELKCLYIKEMLYQKD